ncbi:MAG: enoyl-CoA hydratase [Deltaproteobacteria bacterium]|nr:enoyl-CoA hydratase [Deltaproteobacteria bacterium]
MEYTEILFSTTGPIGCLTLNNPSKINALSLTMIEEMTDALSRVAADESVKVVIIRAAGKHFCAGHYLVEMIDHGVKEYQAIFDNCTEMMQLIHDIPQPVIAQVHGIATAAGCQLVAACDLAVAEEGARFATPGVKIGVFCTTPMVALTRAIGRKAAMEMLLTGRYVSASEAKDLGLINRVVSSDDLTKATEELAEQIAVSSRMVIAIGKRAFYAQVDQPDIKAYEVAKPTMVMNLLTEDAQHGIKSFLEKKTPDWRDR